MTENAPSHSQLLDGIFSDLSNPSNAKNEFRLRDIAEEYSETLHQFWGRTNLEQISPDETFFLNDEENGGFLITRKFEEGTDYVRMTQDSQIVTIRSEIKLEEDDGLKTFYDLHFTKGIISSVEKKVIQENKATGRNQHKTIDQIFINKP